jgi:hypothetical protein
MDGGHQLLAGAALAPDEDRRLRPSGGGDLLAQPGHGRRGSQERALPHRRPKGRHLTLECGAAEGVADGGAQALAAERLLDEVVDPQPERLDRLADRRLAGDHDRGRQAPPMGELAHETDAARPRQAHVHEQQVRGGAGQDLRPCRLHVGDGQHLQPLVLQLRHQAGASARVVLDDDHAGHGASTGSSRRKAAPLTVSVSSSSPRGQQDLAGEARPRPMPCPSAAVVT